VVGGEGVKTTENKINWPCGTLSIQEKNIILSQESTEFNLNFVLFVDSYIKVMGAFLPARVSFDVNNKKRKRTRFHSCTAIRIYVQALARICKPFKKPEIDSQPG
jgi:hypothetical protein